MSVLISPLPAVTKYFLSEEVDLVRGGLFEITHNFGVMPRKVNVLLVCKIDDQGYLAGDVIHYGTQDITDSGSVYSFGVTYKLTVDKVSGVFGSGLTPVRVFYVQNQTGGGRIGLAGESWKMKIEVLA